MSSVVEWRRNSSPHLAVAPSAPLTGATGGAFRKSSHPITRSACAPQAASRTALSLSHTNNNDWHSRAAQDGSNDAVHSALPAAPSSKVVSTAVYHRLLSHSEHMHSLIRHICDEAKALMHAETCSLFLVDVKRGELVAEIVDGEAEGGRGGGRRSIRVPVGHGVVGRVAATKTLLNVSDVARCPFFYPKVDELTGFHTRNILCFPIIDNAGVFVGVLELCNRLARSSPSHSSSSSSASSSCSSASTPTPRSSAAQSSSSGGGFTRHDQIAASTFALYAATSISHSVLHQKVAEAQRSIHMASEMLVQGSRFMIPSDEVSRVCDEGANEPRPTTSFHPHFGRLDFVPRSIGDDLTYVRATVSMFHELGFNARFGIRRHTLASFLVRVANGYRQVPYHNWSHAFAVAHYAFIVLQTPRVRFQLDELERLALLVACCCHDIDHRGTNNAFQVQSKTPLAQLYSSEGSVLEHHHYAQTVSILQQEGCNIFESLNNAQYQTVLSHIRDVILATDIAAHLGKVGRIKHMVQVGYDRCSPDHHYLLMCLLMTASDLSDQTKSFHNNKAIAENIYMEFFNQGDMEKAKGLEPSKMMDRHVAYVPTIQLDFVDTIALPVFDMAARMIPDIEPSYEALLHNRRCWRVLAELVGESRAQPKGLAYLRDEQLEKAVLDTVRREQQQAQQR